MSSSDFHKNQYREHRFNDAEEKEISKKEKVMSGIRAVLQNYISQEESGTATGMGKFDTLIHDRIVEWKAYERKKKTTKFTVFIFFSFFIVPLLVIGDLLSSWSDLLVAGAILFFISYFTQSIKIFIIKGQVPRDTREAKEGVKKAIADIWFETVLSVGFSYIIAFSIIGIMGVFFYLFQQFSGDLIYSITIYFYEIMGLGIKPFNPYFILAVIMTLCLSFILGDLSYYLIFYRKKKEGSADV